MISSAALCQINGFGFSFHVTIHNSIASMSAGTLDEHPRRGAAGGS